MAIFLTDIDGLKAPFMQSDFLKRFGRDAVIITLIFYSIFTMIRNMCYKNDFVLWQEMAGRYPKNALAHSSLGSCLKERGLLDGAIREYKLALSLDPNYAKDHINLGVCYYCKALWDEAAIEFKKALKIDPGNVDAYNNAGVCYANMGRYAEARKAWKKAMEINPENKKARESLMKLKKQTR